MADTFTTNGITVTIQNNSAEVMAALINAVDRGLKACGEKAVEYAQDLCPVNTGNLRGSITYEVDGDECTIGTAVEYAPYVELGTGEYATEGGRQTPWAYQRSDGQWVTTHGNKPQPFIKPAASEHADEYYNTLKDSLQNA